MLRVMLLLMAAILTLSSAEEGKATDYHRSLLGDAPLLFDQTGNRLPAKYLKYLAKQKYLILYFGASTCGPCRKFMPELVAWYHANGGGKNVEVVLVGGDFTTEDIKAYMKNESMPWIAFEKENKIAKADSHFEKIDAKYGCKYQPTLVLLDENDDVVARTNDGDKYLGPQTVFKKYVELTKKK